MTTSDGMQEVPREQWEAMQVVDGGPQVAGVMFAPDTAQASVDMVAALGKLDELQRDKTATITSDKGKFTYSYNNIADVMGAVRPILAAHHLALFNPVWTGDGGRLHVCTEIVHASGHRFQYAPLIVAQPTDMRGLGSAITYLRRYHALSSLGMATEDDDGAAASAAPKSRAKVAETPAAAAAEGGRQMSRPGRGATDARRVDGVQPPPVGSGDEVKQAKWYLAAAAESHGWSNAEVAERFFSDHDVALRDATDVAQIRAFADGLTTKPAVG